MHRCTLTVALAASILSASIGNTAHAATSVVVCNAAGCFTVAGESGEPGNKGGGNAPSGGGNGGDNGGSSCVLPVDALGGVPITVGGKTVLIGGTRCNGAQGPGYYVVNPDPAVPPPEPGDVAASALDGFTWPSPQGRFTPDFASSGGARFPVTQLPVLFAVEPSQWTPLTSSATACNAGGCTTSTVTATPTQLHFDAGDGNTRTCDRPGTIATTAADYEAASLDCAYTYPHSSTTVGGKFQAAIGIEYTISWSSSIGVAGSFPNRTLSTPYEVPVGEIQALVTK